MVRRFRLQWTKNLGLQYPCILGTFRATELSSDSQRRTKEKDFLILPLDSTARLRMCTKKNKFWVFVVRVIRYKNQPSIHHENHKPCCEPREF
jgi:hypothetical protein